MTREIGWENISQAPRSILTVGTFDGVHRGHQAIVEYLLDRAREREGISTVVSFDPHPRSVVHAESVPLLTTVDERASFLADLGIDRFVVVPFSSTFAQLSPEEYVQDVLVRRIGLQEVTVGYDHRFGRKRAGDVDLLKQLGERHGFDVDVIPPQEVGPDIVSSSAIRERVGAGDVQRAAELLGRPYQLAGTVARGKGRGRKIGYPTANLSIPDPRKLVPKNGVYAVCVVLPSGDTKEGMLNIGHRPTFDEMDVTVEVHLLDFEADLYGETLTVQFMQRLRDEQKFASADALATQLSEDEQHCKRVLEDRD